MFVLLIFVCWVCDCWFCFLCCFDGCGNVLVCVLLFIVVLNELVSDYFDLFGLLLLFWGCFVECWFIWLLVMVDFGWNDVGCWICYSVVTLVLIVVYYFVFFNELFGCCIEFVLVGFEFKLLFGFLLLILVCLLWLWFVVIVLIIVGLFLLLDIWWFND